MLQKTTAIIRVVLLLLLCCEAAARAQTVGDFAPIQKFSFTQDRLHIVQTANPRRTFTVTGEHGGIMGRQNGSFELWSFPVKVLSHFEIFAQLDGYPAPIALNERAATIECFPDHTTITYSHAAILIKQHMFAPRSAAGAILGGVVVFEIHAVRSATITFRFEPDMVPEWPAPAPGSPTASWISIGQGGGYLLSSSNPARFKRSSHAWYQPRYGTARLEPS